MTPIFNTSQVNPTMHIWCKFGDYSSYPLQVTVQTSQIAYNFQNQNGKNDLEDQGQWPHFQYQLRVSTDA